MVSFDRFRKNITCKNIITGYLLSVLLGFISLLPIMLVNYDNSSSLVKRDNSDDYANCTIGAQCGNGRCWSDNAENSTPYCQCFQNYITVNEPGVCQYHQISTIATLFMAVFFGMCGAEWCFISQGNGVYVFLGFLKTLTFGGCFVWYFLDIILISTGMLPDGNGKPLGSDTGYTAY